MYVFDKNDSEHCRYALGSPTSLRGHCAVRSKEILESGAPLVRLSKAYQAAREREIRLVSTSVAGDSLIVRLPVGDSERDILPRYSNKTVIVLIAPASQSGLPSLFARSRINLRCARTGMNDTSAPRRDTYSSRKRSRGLLRNDRITKPIFSRSFLAGYGDVSPV